VGCRYLEPSDVIQLYFELTGEADQEVDFVQLERAILRPREGVPGYETYPEMDHKAAVLFEELLRARPFPHRNGIVAALAVYTFYGLNGLELRIDDSELVRLAELVEAGEAGTAAQIAVRFGRFSEQMPDPPD
jgi:prophage maintenance system killer protein